MQWTECSIGPMEKCWVSGIYNIAEWESGGYSAYYMVDGQKNWGNRVSKHPFHKGLRRWPTFADAEQACIEHAKTHEPKPATIKRAAEIMESCCVNEQT